MTVVDDEAPEEAGPENICGDDEVKGRLETSVKVAVQTSARKSLKARQSHGDGELKLMLEACQSS